MNLQARFFLVGLLALACFLPWSSASAQTVEYIHTDALGTPIAVTNASRVVIERSEYEPYGKLLNRPLTDGPGFTGHVQDAATGLTYMQQRYYDPMIGRFLSVDPVTANSGAGANFNRYWYANNNPYRFTDPDGRNAIGRLIRLILPMIVPSSQSGPDDVSGSNDGDIDGDGRADGRGSGTGPIADRPLPRAPGGEPIPDPEAEGAPHSQLGKKSGRNGEYPQAREFDAEGNPVRDIDFTDHGRPGSHPNPHEHPYEENPTGGTRQRGDSQPLDRGDPEPLDPGYPEPLDPGYPKPLDP